MAVLKIMIEYDTDSGEVRAHYPKDKLIAFGMLEMAKVAIVTAPAAQEQGRIQVPEFVPPRLVGGK